MGKHFQSLNQHMGLNAETCLQVMELAEERRQAGKVALNVDVRDVNVSHNAITNELI